MFNEGVIRETGRKTVDVPQSVGTMYVPEREVSSKHTAQEVSKAIASKIEKQDWYQEKPEQEPTRYARARDRILTVVFGKEYVEARETKKIQKELQEIAKVLVENVNPKGVAEALMVYPEMVKIKDASQKYPVPRNPIEWAEQMALAAKIHLHSAIPMLEARGEKGFTETAQKIRKQFPIDTSREAIIAQRDQLKALTQYLVQFSKHDVPVFGEYDRKYKDLVKPTMVGGPGLVTELTQTQAEIADAEKYAKEKLEDPNRPLYLSLQNAFAFQKYAERIRLMTDTMLARAKRTEKQTPEQYLPDHFNIVNATILQVQAEQKVIRELPELAKQRYFESPMIIDAKNDMYAFFYKRGFSEDYCYKLADELGPEISPEILSVLTEEDITDLFQLGKGGEILSRIAVLRVAGRRTFDIVNKQIDLEGIWAGSNYGDSRESVRETFVNDYILFIKAPEDYFIAYPERYDVLCRIYEELFAQYEAPPETRERVVGRINALVYERTMFRMLNRRLTTPRTAEVDVYDPAKRKQLNEIERAQISDARTASAQRVNATFAGRLKRESGVKAVERYDYDDLRNTVQRQVGDLF
jgi:hypothetical protein